MKNFLREINFKPALLTLSLSLGAGLATSNAESSGNKRGSGPAKKARLFPAPDCDVENASTKLGTQLARAGVPTWDGNLPWPLMIGYWNNLSRDTYVTVSMEEIRQSEFGRVVVTFRSICGYFDDKDDNYLAYGAKIVTQSDFKNKELVIKLRNLALGGGLLEAVLEMEDLVDTKQNQRSPEQASKNQAKLKITIRGTSLSDTFVAEKMISK